MYSFTEKLVHGKVTIQEFRRDEDLSDHKMGSRGDLRTRIQPELA